MSGEVLFNLTGPDLAIIVLITLGLFGAQKLPVPARRLGEAVEDLSTKSQALRPAVDLCAWFLAGVIAFTLLFLAFRF